MKIVVLQQNYKLNMAGEVCGFEDDEAQRLVDSGAAKFHAPAAAPVKGRFVVMKKFQSFTGEKHKAGEILELTAEEAELLGPERVAPAPPEHDPA